MKGNIPKLKINKDKIYNHVLNALMETFPVVMNEIANDMKSIYMDAIDEYYHYGTRMYIRHGQDKPYTKTGINLYSAISIYTIGGGFGIHCEMEPSKLLPYDIEGDGSRDNVRSVIYRDGKPHYFYKSVHTNDSRETVLNMIVSGQRYGVGPWYLPEFNSKYFKITATKLEDVEKDIEKQFKNVAMDMVVSLATKKIRGDIFG